MAEIVSVLVLRHLAIGAENVAFTLAAGFAVVWLMQRLDFSGQITFSKAYALRRFVCFAALLKGAIYTLAGLSMKKGQAGSFSYGFQFPDPRSLLVWHDPPSASLLHPTKATYWIVSLLLAFAAARLIARINGVRATLNYAESLRLPLSEEESATLQCIVRDCADYLKKPELRHVPIEVIHSAEISTSLGGLPLVVGVANPRIVIDAWWLELSHTHSEAFHAAIRHELMHIAYGHHRSRWLLLWLRDVAALTGLGNQTFNELLACDEIICDTRSTRSASDAKAMSQAIWLAHERLVKANASFPLAAANRETEVFARLSGIHADASKIDKLQIRRLRTIAVRLGVNVPVDTHEILPGLVTLLRSAVTLALLLPLGILLSAIVMCRVYSIFF